MLDIQTLSQDSGAILEACAELALRVHRRAAQARGLPVDHLSCPFFLRGMSTRLTSGSGLCAIHDGVVKGSVFFGSYPESRIGVLGPLTADSNDDEHVGTLLLRSALSTLENAGIVEVRLNQNPCSEASYALYANAGFRLLEPLVVVRFPEAHSPSPSAPQCIDDAHLGFCADLSLKCFGVRRTSELERAVSNLSAFGLLRGGSVVAYATGVGLQQHAVSDTTEDLIELIVALAAPSGRCFVPAHDTDLLSALLGRGCRIDWFANLMSTKATTYRRPHVPSLAG